jgi:immune inhibitor A
MSGGSWGGGGDTPVHPCGWCKANQGWVTVDNRTTNSVVQIHDVKDSHTVYRLWKDGTAGQEYFLVENRQRTGFDASLPESGLLVWHIDESIAGNTDENHYKVALMQADGKRDLELNHNRGDSGDPYPGSTNNTAFNATSTPNSKSYAGADTCVAVTGISASSPVMSANLQVSCRIKIKEQHKEIIKEVRKELHKELIKEWDKTLWSDKRPEKPIIDKGVTFDKGFVDKATDGKLGEGKPAEGGGGNFGVPTQPLEQVLQRIESRLAALEGAVSQAAAAGSARQPFIGSALRPDLSQGALLAEEDFAQIQREMQAGSAHAKRVFDSKPPEHTGR